MRRFSRTIYGFTLTETLISLGLTIGVGAIIAVVLSSGSLLRRTESARTELLTQSRIIDSKLREAFSHALRPLGASKSAYTGVKVLKDFGMTADTKGVVIMAEHYGSLSTPVLVVPNGQNGPEVHIKVEPGDLSADFIFKSLSAPANQFYSIANMNNSNIVKKAGPPQQIGDAPPRYRVPIDSNHFSAADFQGGTTLSMRAVEAIVFKFEDGKLIRTVHGNLPASGALPDHFGRQVLSDNMVSFEVDFSFTSRGDNDIILPGRRLSHPDDYLVANGCQPSSGNICCTNEEQAAGRCVTFHHIETARVEFTLFKEVSGVQALPPTGDGFAQLNDLIQYTHRSEYIPSRFAFGAYSTGMITSEYKCPLRDFASRCNPDCIGENGPFKNQDLNADGSYPADWWEYGDLNSNYCKCGTVSGTFVPPETNTNRIPSWNPAGGEDQPILYCAKHFPSCASAGGESWIMSKYPLAKLSCWCIQPSPNSWLLPNTPHYRRELNDSVESYGSFILNLSRDLNSANHLLGGLNADPHTEHNMRCYLWRACDAAAQAYFTNNSRPTAWFDRCSCLSYQKNENGNSNNSKTHRIQADFNRLCNTDYRQGLAAQPACPSTIDTTTQRYYMKSATDPQGLDEEDIRFCECYNQKGFNSTNQSYGNSNSFDFRTGTPLQDPLLTPGSVPSIAGQSAAHTKFGTLQSMSVSTTAINRASGTAVTVDVAGNCDLSYCNLLHHAGVNLGCCTADRNIQWVPNNRVLQQRPELMNILNGAHGDYTAWASYCSPECTGGTNIRVANTTVNEVHRVREIITGTSRGGTVPPACGQWNQGSGLGQ